MVDAERPKDALAVLTVGYRTQKRLYGSLLELAEQQREIIERHGDVRGWISLLRKRDDIIRQIDVIEKRMSPYKKNLPDVSSKSSRELNGLLDEVIPLIEECIRYEQENNSREEAETAVGLTLKKQKKQTSCFS